MSLGVWVPAFAGTTNTGTGVQGHARDISCVPPESPARKTCYFWVMVTDPTPIFRSRFNVTAVVPQAAL
jgi:hypothetical protein